MYNACLLSKDILHIYWLILKLHLPTTFTHFVQINHQFCHNQLSSIVVYLAIAELIEVNCIHLKSNK